MTKKTKDKIKKIIVEHGKVPPQAIEFEEAVLGAILIEENAINEPIRILKSEMFYKESHRLIYKAIETLFNKSYPIDMLTVANELKTTNKLDIIGGPYYITQLTNKVASSINVGFHSKIIVEKYLLRQIIKISHIAQNKAYNEEEDVFIILEDLLKQLDTLYATIEQSRIKTSKDIFGFIVDNLSNEDKSGQYRTLLTGDEEFDMKLQLETNQQLLLAAKSGAGKTSFLIWLVKKYLERYSDIISINWFCMEDSLLDIQIHMLCGDILKNNKEIKQNKLTQEEREIIMNLRSQYESYDIEYHDQPTSIDNIYASHMSFVKKRPNRFNLLIIDNVMTLLDNDQQNQNKADDYISRQLIKIRKNASAISDNATIVLHHYNDEQLKKDNLKIAYRPIEKDIRGSTRYRDCSTIILLMNNPANYPDLLAEYKNDVELLKSLMLFDITKNRLNKEGSLRSLKSLDYKLFKFTTYE